MLLLKNHALLRRCPVHGWRRWRRRSDGFVRISASIVLLFGTGSVAAQSDFSGVWVAAADLAQPWIPEPSDFTERGIAAVEEYDRNRQDSTMFCMPLGTPRNVLSTAPYPVEILQRPEQLTMIFDGLGDVRRVFLDGRSHPPDPVPNWMGHSIGAWEGDALTVDTVAMTSESRLSSSGLAHSESMRLTETWRLIERGGEALLSVTIRLEDPIMYRRALLIERYFRRAPHAEFTETLAYCHLDQWRTFLERHSKELSTSLRDDDATMSETPR